MSVENFQFLTFSMSAVSRSKNDGNIRVVKVNFYLHNFPIDLKWEKGVEMEGKICQKVSMDKNVHFEAY